MPDRQVDPTRLKGHALSRWYLRSSDDIERERQAAAAQRYDAFFGGEYRANPDPGFVRQLPPSARSVDPGFSAIPRGFTPGWPNQMSPDALSQTPNDAGTGFGLDRGLAGPDDGGELIDIGSKSRQHRRGWERREDNTWPRVAETGENFHVSHIIAKADGGPDTLENIKPVHPVEHMAQHRANGDFGRWALRRVRPQIPKGGITLKGLGVLGIIPTITGLMSGRIRTDSPLHFWYDMAGFPSPDEAPFVPDVI